MNIFAIDADPVKAAKQMHDKHVNKMIVESAQMLSTVRRHYGDHTSGLYKSCFVKHPCTLWVKQSLSNYLWLCFHFKALCEEYTYRYYKIHKTHNLLVLLSRELVGIPDIGLTPFATAMPDKYKVNNPIQSYRNYYLGQKIQNKYWTNRTKDELDPWLSSHLSDDQFKVSTVVQCRKGLRVITKRRTS